MSALTGLMNKVLDMDYVWIEEGKIWFIGQRLKCLFCADIDKKEIDVVFKLPDNFEMGYREYIQVIKCEDKLICLPSRAKDILIYNMNNCNIRTVVIKEYKDTSKMWCKNAGILNGKMYIIEGIARRIIVFNVIEEEIAEVYDIKYLDQDDRIGEHGTIYNNCLYIPVATKQKFISFDVSTTEFKEHFVSGDICGINLMYSVNGYCWIIGEHYGIMRWDPATGDFFEIKNIPEEFKVFIVDTESKKVNWYSYSEKVKYNVDHCFCRECLHGEKYIWIIPESSDSIIRINTDIMQIKLFQFKEEYSKMDFLYKMDGYEFSALGIDSKQKLRIVARQKYNVYCIGTEDLSYQIESWRLSKETVKLVIKNLVAGKVWEDEQINLKTLIYGEIKGYLGEKSKVKRSIKGREIYSRL